VPPYFGATAAVVLTAADVVIPGDVVVVEADGATVVVVGAQDARISPSAATQHANRKIVFLI